MSEQEQYFLFTVRLEALKLAVEDEGFESDCEETLARASAYYKFLKEGVTTNE